MKKSVHETHQIYDLPTRGQDLEWTGGNERPDTFKELFEKWKELSHMVIPVVKNSWDGLKINEEFITRLQMIYINIFYISV